MTKAIKDVQDAIDMLKQIMFDKALYQVTPPFKIYPGALIDVNAVNDLMQLHKLGLGISEWSDMVDKEYDTPDTSILADASKLTINKLSFEEAPAEKKKILMAVKKLSILQQFGEDDLVKVVYLYFTPEKFLEVTTKYPWLLDSKLGEKEVVDFNPPWPWQKP